MQVTMLLSKGFDSKLLDNYFAAKINTKAFSTIQNLMNSESGSMDLLKLKADECTLNKCDLTIKTCIVCISTDFFPFSNHYAQG